MHDSDQTGKKHKTMLLMQKWQVQVDLYNSIILYILAQGYGNYSI